MLSSFFSSLVYKTFIHSETTTFNYNTINPKRFQLLLKSKVHKVCMDKRLDFVNLIDTIFLSLGD